MEHCKNIDRKPNLIEHMSIHDGTRRSLQACHIIEQFNPQDSVDMARILKRENTMVLGRLSYRIPLFWDIKRLVLFCGKESRKSDMYGGWENVPEDRKKSLGEEGRANYDKWHHWYMDRCVSHADGVDLLADIWKLSPVVNRNYPSEKKIYMGTDIGEGWHTFKRETEEMLEY